MSFEDRLGFQLKRVGHELAAATTAAVKPAGLTVAQYSALLVLDSDPGISAAALARRCLVSPQTMTTILRNLEAAGFIERTPHPHHRQVIETRPTAKGHNAVVLGDTRAKVVERHLAEAFSPDELTRLREYLLRCSDVLVAEIARDKAGAAATSLTDIETGTGPGQD